MTPSGSTGSRQLESVQRAPQLAQFAEQRQAQHLGEVPGGGLPAVRPHPQPLAGRRQQCGAQRPAVAAAAVRGVDDQFGGRASTGSVSSSCA